MSSRTIDMIKATGIRRIISTKSVLIVLMYLPAIMAVGLLVLNRALTDIPTHYLTWDVASVAHLPVYIGIFSSIGIILWGGTVVVSFFCFLLLKVRFADRTPLFFLLSGMITVLLLLDDMLELRARLYPYYLHADKNWIEMLYVVLVLAFLAVFRKQVQRTEYVYLLIAGAFFALSVGIDVAGVEFFASTILEDGSKLLGITSWFAYFFISGYVLITDQLTNGEHNRRLSS